MIKTTSIFFAQIVLCMIIFLGCSFIAREKQQEISEEVIIEPSKRDGMVKEFVFANDTLEQRIKIIDEQLNQINFEYIISNKRVGCIQTIKGVAIDSKPNLDPELDEDEEGFGYPAIEYGYNKNGCYLYIRRAMIEKDKVQIKASKCADNQSSCPIESVGILR